MSHDEQDTSQDQQTRARILDAARSLLQEGGEEAVTMRALARRASIGTMTTYRHFDSRDAVLAALVVEGFERFGATIVQAATRPTPAARLWWCGEHYLTFATEHPNTYALMFSSARPLADLPLGEEDRQIIGSALSFLVKRVLEVRGQRADDEAALARARADAARLWSLCHGLICLHTAGRYDTALDFPTFYRSSVRLYLSALGLLADLPPI